MWLRLSLPSLWVALSVGATPCAVGGRSSVTVPQGADLLVDFSVWTYGYHNPGYSAYPTEIGIQIVAPPLPARAGLRASTLQYAPQYLFQGWLESLDGLVSTPLVDYSARRLGLPDGSALVVPGTLFRADGTATDIAVLNALALVSQFESQAVFGDHVGDRGESARIRLRNLGDDFEIGMGEGYTVRQSVSLPGVAGDGPTRTSGYVSEVYVEIPEPSSALLVLGAILIFLLCRRPHRCHRS